MQVDLIHQANEVRAALPLSAAHYFMPFHQFLHLVSVDCRSEVYHILDSANMCAANVPVPELCPLPPGDTPGRAAAHSRPATAAQGLARLVHTREQRQSAHNAKPGPTAIKDPGPHPCPQGLCLPDTCLLSLQACIFWGLRHFSGVLTCNDMGVLGQMSIDALANAQDQTPSVWQGGIQVSIMDPVNKASASIVDRTVLYRLGLALHTILLVHPVHSTYIYCQLTQI